MSRELELKYTVKDADALVGWLDRHLPAASPAAGWRQARVTDRYFDTATGALAAAGYGARLRHRDGTTTLGLKSDGHVRGGIHRREELEAPANASLEPVDWPSTEVRSLVEQTAGSERLIERFVLDQFRREREYSARGSTVLLSVDRVEVRRAEDRFETLEQLEIELLSGDPSSLAELGRVVEASGLVEREPRSKMSIAAELIG